MNIQEFTKQFPDNESCLKWLFVQRYPTAKCPKCKRVNKYHLQAKTSHFVCICGKHQLSPKKDTIFQASDTDMQKWFYALFLFSVSKNGVAAKELQRQLQVTYKTAWRIGHQIRKLLAEHGLKLSGIVEADETYVGVKGKKKGRGAENKTPVFGMVERGGKVKAMPVEDVSRYTLTSNIKNTIVTSSTLMTDEFPSYTGVKKWGYKHRTVNHGRRQYVKGINHTNTIEGFWSQLKRSIHGTYHAVSPKHLQSYVNEFSYRYNRRKQDVFSSLMEGAVRPV